MIAFMVFVAFLFRRLLFEWLIGKVGICVLEAVVFTGAAAMLFAAPGEWVLLSYILGFFCVLAASYSVITFNVLTTEGNNVN